MAPICVLITKNKYNNQRRGQSWVAVIPRRKLASCSEKEAKKIIAEYVVLKLEDDTRYDDLDPKLEALLVGNLERLDAQNGTLYTSNLEPLRCYLTTKYSNIGSVVAGTS